MKQYIVTVKNSDGIGREIQVEAPNRFQAEHLAMHRAYIDFGAGWQPVRTKEVLSHAQ